MPIGVSIAGHGAGAIVTTDGVRVVLDSPSPSPPGSSLSFIVEGASQPFKIKVSVCKRGDSESAGFRIEGRLVDATREQRAALQSMVHGGSS